MTLGAYTESGIYIMRMNSAWEVQKCYQELASIAESAAYMLYWLEQNLDPSTNLWPPWACHCWECHQQNVGEILHEKNWRGRENTWTNRSECFTVINIIFQHSVWPTTRLTISEDARFFREREIGLKTCTDKHVYPSFGSTVFGCTFSFYLYFLELLQILTAVWRQCQ